MYLVIAPLSARWPISTYFVHDPAFCYSIWSPIYKIYWELRPLCVQIIHNDSKNIHVSRRLLRLSWDGVSETISSTGATGYVGGDALYALQKAHPEHEYTALVRNSDSGAQIASVFPKVRLVYGTLDDSDLLEEESAMADVIIRKYFFW